MSSLSLPIPFSACSGVNIDAVGFAAVVNDLDEVLEDEVDDLDEVEEEEEEDAVAEEDLGTEEAEEEADEED